MKRRIFFVVMTYKSGEGVERTEKAKEIQRIAAGIRDKLRSLPAPKEVGDWFFEPKSVYPMDGLSPLVYILEDLSDEDIDAVISRLSYLNERLRLYIR